MECIGALDAGTQSIRFCLYAANGHQVGHHQMEFAQHTPKPGWLEHDPFDLVNVSKECMSKALEATEAQVGPVKVKAFGITNQRETTILWDRRTGNPFYNAIVWSDLRTQEICREMESEHGGQDAFREITGLPISTYFSAFKAKWLMENVDGVNAAGAGNVMFGTVETWIMYNLTGGRDGGIHVTDVSNASRTMLLDLRSCDWSEDMLGKFGMHKSMLPKVVSNAEVYGHVRDEGGPMDGVPIAGCLGDQHAALLGEPMSPKRGFRMGKEAPSPERARQVMDDKGLQDWTRQIVRGFHGTMSGQRCRQGEAKNTYGTGCFMLLNTGPNYVRSTHGLLTTLAFRLGPKAQTQYALEGSIAVAGLGISWMQKNLGILSSAKESEVVASEVEDTGGVYFVPAFSGHFAPYWRSDARAVLVGMTLATRKAHVVRAMLEAICFQTKEIMDAMRKDSGLELASLRADGGATANNLLMQLQADILLAPVIRPAYQESTAMGAAFAAGLGIGLWDEGFVFEGTDEGAVTRFTPQLSPEELQPRFQRWQDAVRRSFDLA